MSDKFVWRPGDLSDRRQVLADDIRRLAGLGEAALGEAASLQLEIPEDVARCIAAWRHWAQQLRDADHD